MTNELNCAEMALRLNGKVQGGTNLSNLPEFSPYINLIEECFRVFNFSPRADQLYTAIKLFDSNSKGATVLFVLRPIGANLFCTIYSFYTLISVH